MIKSSYFGYQNSTGAQMLSLGPRSPVVVEGRAEESQLAEIFGTTTAQEVSQWLIDVK